MTPPLSLIPAPHTDAAISAGWLPSTQPSEWLAEIGHCHRQGKPVKAYLVARSLSDPRPAGVFLVPAGKGLPAFRPQVQTLRELIPGVHGPLASRLSAGLTEPEREFFFRGFIHFFHPALGLITFEERDQVTPLRMLQTPQSRSTDWNRAVPAVPASPPLRSLHVAEPPNPEEMISGIGDDIGSEAGKSPAGKLGDLTKKLGKGIAGGALVGLDPLLGGVLGTLGKGLGMLPGGAGMGQSITRQLRAMREWAEKNWKDLADRRQSEINRLMKLMEDNPEEGLRYALPLAGSGGAGRGISPPSTRLGTRSTMFSHGGSGPMADQWSLEQQDRLKLEKQYRAAALRELALGHFDRAAYIYGNLLGDWHSAAKALGQGGRHQDAVAIYIHKLNNRLGAARMLESGGFLLQAAAYFAEEKQFEKAGDLYATLGHDDQAREMWRTAIEAHTSPLEKARILSEKLRDDPAALAVLNLAWLSNQQVPAAVAAMFAICRKRSDPGAAIVLLRRIFDAESHPAGSLAKLDLAFSETGKWPDEALRAELDRLAYPCVAAAIAHKAPEARRALWFLSKLDPADVLIDRDIRRSMAATPPKVAASGSFSGVLEPKSIIKLDPKVSWECITSIPGGVSVAGAYKLQLKSVHVTRKTATSIPTGDEAPLATDRISHISTTHDRLTHEVFHFEDQFRLYMRTPGRARTAHEEDLGSVGHVLAISNYGGNGEFLVLTHERTEALTAHLYSPLGVLRRSNPLEYADPARSREVRWLIGGQPGHTIVAVGQTFVWIFADDSYAVAALPDGETARSLEMSPPGAPPEALVCTENMVTLFSPGRGTGRPEAVNLWGESRGNPSACFLPDGSIAIVSGQAGLILSPQQRSQTIARINIPGAKGSHATGISRSGDGGFAILMSDGRVVFYGH